MLIEFRLPDLGEGLTEGELVEWLVRPGESISLDQPMAIVATDKATIEMPAPAAGRVKDLCVEEGQVIPIQTLLLTIEQDQHEQAFLSPLCNESTPSEPSPFALRTPDKQETIQHASRPLATPAVRRQMRELGIDPTSVQGHGEAGRILPADIQAYKQPYSNLPSDVSQNREDQQCDHELPQLMAVERIPLRGVRRRIAENIAYSLRHIPQGTLFFEVDATTLVQLKKTMQVEYARQQIKLSYLPFLVRAVVLALQEHCHLNACVDETTQEILLKKMYHIGIATATSDGLLVPVIHRADRMNVLEVARQVMLISEKRATHSFERSELTGSTFTISNYGSLGGTFSTPIINPGEGAILGVGRIAQHPRVIKDQIVIRHILPLSLTIDHRMLDGDDGLQFLNTLKLLLENPSRLLSPII